MKNLAGDKNCDDTIKLELRRAGIPFVKDARHTGEVPYSVTGCLGKFTFVRAWYYWMVRGNLPLEVAKELHENPVGKTDVRVVGHCGCPPPEEWATKLDGELFVTSYHIDSEEGLALFAETLRKHDLAPLPA